jgi:hypothetical protein
MIARPGRHCRSPDPAFGGRPTLAPRLPPLDAPPEVAQPRSHETVRIEPLIRTPVLAAYLTRRALTKSPTAAARDYCGTGPRPSRADLERIAGQM